MSDNTARFQSDYGMGMKCARCGEYTGNWHQGHYWKFCKKVGELTEFHFCCPTLDCDDQSHSAPTDAEDQAVPQTIGPVSPPDQP